MQTAKNVARIIVSADPRFDNDTDNWEDSIRPIPAPKFQTLDPKSARKHAEHLTSLGHTNVRTITVPMVR